MTNVCLVNGHEPAGAAQPVSVAGSQVSNWRQADGRSLWMVARSMKWVGYFGAGVSLIFVFSGSGLWTLIVAVACAFIGSLGSLLAHELGLPGALKGLRVYNVFTPVCLSVPNYTRVGDLLGQHPSFGKDCCVVVLCDGYIAGIHVGDQSPAALAEKIEQHMHPISWVEAVELGDNAIGALEHMKRHRRKFIPVVKGDRLVGIVRQDRISRPHGFHGLVAAEVQEMERSNDR